MSKEMFVEVGFKSGEVTSIKDVLSVGIDEGLLILPCSTGRTKVFVMANLNGYSFPTPPQEEK
jgi:hypothetical protein